MSTEESFHSSEPLLRAGHGLHSGVSYRIGLRPVLLEAAWAPPEVGRGCKVQLVARLAGAHEDARVQFEVFAGERIERAAETVRLEATAVRVGPAGAAEARATWTVRDLGADRIPEIGDEASGPRPADEREAGRATAPAGDQTLRFEARLGRERRTSPPLTVRRTIDISFSGASGAEYCVLFADASTRQGRLSSDGRLLERDCPQGAYSVALRDRSFPTPRKPAG